MKILKDHGKHPVHRVSSAYKRYEKAFYWSNLGENIAIAYHANFYYIYDKKVTSIKPVGKHQTPDYYFVTTNDNETRIMQADDFLATKMFIKFEYAPNVKFEVISDDGKYVKVKVIHES